MPNKPVIRSRRLINDTGIFRIEEMDLEFANGATRVYQRLLGSSRGAVMVVPLLDEKTVLLIREYTAGMERYELSFVKGRVEDGENLLDAANRELQEEVGYAAGRLDLIRSVTMAPGYLLHNTHIVLARNLYPKRLPGDEPEPIEVVPWKLDDLDALLLRDDFTESRSITAFYLAKELLAREKTTGNKHPVQLGCPYLRRILFWIVTGTVCLLVQATTFAGQQEPDTAFEFEDRPLQEPMEHPGWFKQSFLDLQEDLKEALAADKMGIIVYFGQRRCAYCKLLMTVNFGQHDISTYTQRNFDVIPIDIWGVDEVVDMNGVTLTEREFALREKTNFTPSLIFYDRTGAEALRLRGYYPPYKFRAALEYVADGHFRKESFVDFLERGSDALAFEPGELNDETFFSPPPFALDRRRFPAERPLAVFFEQGDCHACNVLHSQPLGEAAISDLFRQFENVQLDINADTPVITPDGEMTSARKWARKLGLFYTPSILFFDQHGKEIIRVDSVVQFYRLRNVLLYVAGGGYMYQSNYQLWRLDSGF